MIQLEMNFVHLSHDRVTFDVDRDVLTAILLVFIMRAYCSSWCKIGDELCSFVSR